jgi:hypothetical protein
VLAGWAAAALLEDPVSDQHQFGQRASQGGRPAVLDGAAGNICLVLTVAHHASFHKLQIFT